MTKPTKAQSRRSVRVERVEDSVRSQPGPAPIEPFKAAVVASLLVGQDPLFIAERFGLTLPAVQALRERYSLTAPVRRANYISDLLVTFVEQEFASLMAISIATSDEDLIKSQNAQDLAMLIGVKHDRLMRIFEAWSHPNGVGPQEIEGESIPDADFDLEDG